MASADLGNELAELRSIARQIELRMLRAVADGLAASIARLDTGEPPGGLSRVMKTTTLGTYPTASGTLVTYALIPCDVLGDEVEGDAAGATTGGGHVMGVNVGGSIPPVNTLVIAHDVGTAWVFEYR